mgnify:CR=1 FL=1
MTAARLRAALAVLAVDPAGLGGLWLRARAGGARDAVTRALVTPGLRVLRLHPGVTEAALSGGIDLAASLAAGAAVRGAGLLDGPAAVVLAMAERCPPALGARLGQWLDRNAGCLIALDEGAEATEGCPPALADRLGLFLDLDGLREADGPAPDPARVAAARGRLAVVGSGDAPARLATLAAALGIGSLRAPLFALAAARAHAALRGAASVAEEDLALAAELTLAHRALPAPDPDEAPPPPADAPDDAPAAGPGERTTLPDEILLEAVRAALPADLLARLAAGRAARPASGASGTGAARRGNRRGRPLASTPGRPDGAARLDPVATLRAAAPWQSLRRAATGRGTLEIRPRDFRVRRFRETSDRVLIFAVDASGSAALARLAEAKGAVELLLAQAYARRDHVALVAFRGADAEVLLPPTRSLVQAKRRLAALPGGGGTPLAAGLRAGMELARAARARGMTPTLALLTDGRANVALDGAADRPRALADAERLARLVAAARTPAVVLDTATRPQPGLRALAGLMGAAYLPLPRADAHRLSQALAGTLNA